MSLLAKEIRQYCRDLLLPCLLFETMRTPKAAAAIVQHGEYLDY
jgi:hypothetical protein